MMNPLPNFLTHSMPFLRIWYRYSPSPTPTLVNVVQSGSEMIHTDFSIVFFGGEGGMFVSALREKKKKNSRIESPRTFHNSTPKNVKKFNEFRIKNNVHNVSDIHLHCIPVKGNHSSIFRWGSEAQRLDFTNSVDSVDNVNFPQ